MRFEYNDKKYELAELREPNSNATFDIIAIFEVGYKKFVGFDLVDATREEYEKQEYEVLEEYVMINYFFGASLYDEEEMIKIALEYIERK